MADEYSVILNGLNGYYAQTDLLTNALAAGPHHLINDVRIVSGFDVLEHTLAVVTVAADVRALKILYNIGGFAIWQIYDAQEGFSGYLIIKDSGDVVVEVEQGTPTGAWAIAVRTMTDEVYLAGTFAYLKTDAASSDFSESDQVPAAITAAKGYAIPVEA